MKRWIIVLLALAALASSTLVAEAKTPIHCIVLPSGEMVCSMG
jgi:hypothetical protein